MDTCGQRIKIIREAAGLSQEELGKRIGTTGVTIMRYEKGQREPKLEQLNRIANAMSVSVNFFLSAQPFEDLAVLTAFKSKILEFIDTDGLFLQGRSQYDDLSDYEFWIILSCAVASIVRMDDQTLEIQPKAPAENRSRLTDDTASNATFSAIIKRLGAPEQIALAEEVLRNFALLNPDGRKKAAERIEELLEITRYRL